MNKEKLKEIRLTKKAKYGVASMFLVAILGIGVASVATRGNSGDVTNNENQQVTVTPDTSENEAPVVVAEDEKMGLPFTVDAKIKTYYFDASDTSKEQENALIYYNGMYTPSTGIDYAYNNSNFVVVAAFSGIVTEKKVDPVYGATLYVKSDENPNVVAVYASLANIEVSVGDRVKQGDQLARAGSNTINASMGNHLNFSLLVDGKKVDPLDYYLKVIKEI